MGERITRRWSWERPLCLSLIISHPPSAWCLLVIGFLSLFSFGSYLSLFCFYNRSVFLPHLPYFFLFLFLTLPPSLPIPLFFPHRMLQPVPKQEGRTVVVVNSPRTPLGPVPVRPPPGPELSAQPTPGPTPPVLPAPLMVSASPSGPPLIPASRPPGPVLLPPLQPNSGPLPQGELQGSQDAGGYFRQIVRIGGEVMKFSV